jgi:hypothetical protein
MDTFFHQCSRRLDLLRSMAKETPFSFLNPFWGG